MKKTLGIVTALILTLLGTVIPAGTASAHTAGINANCQKLHVNLSNYARGGDNMVKVVINGQVVANEAFERGFNQTFDFPQDRVNTWSVDVDAFDDNRYDAHESGTQKPCNKPKQPAPEKLTDAMSTCSDGGYSATRTGTQPYVWNEDSWSWVLGAVDWGRWVKTPYTDAEYAEKCAGDNPGPKYSEWSDWSGETPTCDDLTVTQTRTREKTTFEWNLAKRDWDATVETETDTRTVTMTDEQFALDCKPEQPAPKMIAEDKAGCDLNEVGGTAVRTGTEAYVWSVKDREWVLSGDVVWSGWIFTAYTDEEYFSKCAPKKPSKDPVVTYSEFGGEAPTCAAPKVEWTREITTKTFTYDWNAETRVWDETVSTETVTDPETETHTLSEDEVQACKPVKDPEITYGEFGGKKPTCDNPKVTWSRDVVTTAYSYTLNEETLLWVESADTVTTTETKTVKLDADTDCTPEETLAYTGNDGAAPLSALGLFALLAGSLMMRLGRA